MKEEQEAILDKFVDMYKNPEEMSEAERLSVVIETRDAGIKLANSTDETIKDLEAQLSAAKLTIKDLKEARNDLLERLKVQDKTDDEDDQKVNADKVVNNYFADLGFKFDDDTQGD